MKNLKNKRLLKILQKSLESKRAVEVTFKHNLGGRDEKFVCAHLPRPNSAEEDGYGGGGVKISAAGASTAATRSRQ